MSVWISDKQGASVIEPNMCHADPSVEAYLGLTSSLPCYSQTQIVAAGEASGVEMECRTIRSFVLALMQEPIAVQPPGCLFLVPLLPSTSLSLPPT
jgi:hypothetical protein